MSSLTWAMQSDNWHRLPAPDPTCAPAANLGGAEVVEWRWRPTPRLSDDDVDRIARRVAKLLRAPAEDMP